MRSFTALWLPALAALVSAAQPSGHIYFYDQDSRPGYEHHHSVDAKTAALILASRFGLTQYYELGAASDDSILAINALGHQNKLFARPEGHTPQVVLVAEESDHLDKSYKHKLEVTTMPGKQATNALLGNLQAQELAEMREDGPRMNMVSTVSDDETVADWHARGYDVIVVVAPKTTSSKSTYGRLAAPSTLHKRQAEAPLEDFPTWTTSVDENDNGFTIYQDDDDTNNTSPLAGILPSCFTSKSACESTTRNCTGHGSCTLAYTQRDSTGDSEGTPCFQCACVPSVQRNSDGTTKTTTWAGPACQKKDVSVAFWLIGGFTVFMVFLVSWGVGTIWSMGEEELPSVIGAGVSGPTKK